MSLSIPHRVYELLLILVHNDVRYKQSFFDLAASHFFSFTAFVLLISVRLSLQALLIRCLKVSVHRYFVVLKTYTLLLTHYISTLLYLRPIIVHLPS